MGKKSGWVAYRDRAEHPLVLLQLLTFFINNFVASSSSFDSEVLAGVDV
jgi:hypothetical protein